MNDLSEQLKSFSGPAVQAFPCAFGNYVLLYELATGGMGTVFIARSGGIGDIQKLSVIKTLRSHFAGDQDYVVRFMDEARVVVALDHRNICRVSDVGFTDGRYYLAMEFIRGADMRAVWRRHADLGQGVPEDISFYLIAETLEALDYSHRLTDESTGESLCLVHRDISPQNVMVGFEGEVKIIDFGLAASTMKLEKTAPQVVMGKVGYMSPEQARGDPVDKQTDLFAAGIVLYEMLTGKRYYDGMGAHQIWAVVGTGDHVPAYLNSLDVDVQTVLKKALHADKAHRFSDCAEFRTALRDLAYERHHRAGASELRKSMEENFALEIAGLRERVASFSQLTDVYAESGPALAAAGKSEAEMTQTSSRLSPDIDTGETRTEKVAPSRVMVFEDDDLALGPRTERAPLALGLAAAAILVLAVMAAVVFSGGDDPPLPVIAGLSTAVPEAAVPEAAVPETAVPETAVPETAVGPVTPKPPPAVTTTVGQDGFEISPASKLPKSVKKETKPGRKSSVKNSRRGPRRAASRGTRTARKPVRRSSTKRPSIVKTPPPPLRGSWTQKMSYLKKWCPKADCTRWLSKRHGRFKEIDSLDVKTYMNKMPICLKGCAKR